MRKSLNEGVDYFLTIPIYPPLRELQRFVVNYALSSKPFILIKGKKSRKTLAFRDILKFGEGTLVQRSSLLAWGIPL